MYVTLDEYVSIDAAEDGVIQPWLKSLLITLSILSVLIGIPGSLLCIMCRFKTRDPLRQKHAFVGLHLLIIIYFSSVEPISNMIVLLRGGTTTMSCQMFAFTTCFVLLMHACNNSHLAISEVVKTVFPNRNFKHPTLRMILLLFVILAVSAGTAIYRYSGYKNTKTCWADKFLTCFDGYRISKPPEDLPHLANIIEFITALITVIVISSTILVLLMYISKAGLVKKLYRCMVVSQSASPGCSINLEAQEKREHKKNKLDTTVVLMAVYSLFIWLPFATAFELNTSRNTSSIIYFSTLIGLAVEPWIVLKVNTKLNRSCKELLKVLASNLTSYKPNHNVRCASRLFHSKVSPTTNSHHSHSILVETLEELQLTLKIIEDSMYIDAEKQRYKIGGSNSKQKSLRPFRSNRITNSSRLQQGHITVPSRQTSLKPVPQKPFTHLPEPMIREEVSLTRQMVTPEERETYEALQHTIYAQLNNSPKPIMR